MNGKYLFLDDVRVPKDVTWVNLPSPRTEWTIVRNYDAFVQEIELNGVPDFISFDHDLSDEHFTSATAQTVQVFNQMVKTFKEKTGYDCARWLIDYCITRGIELPKYAVHSMNPTGASHIQLLLANRSVWNI